MFRYKGQAPDLLGKQDSVYEGIKRFFPESFTLHIFTCMRFLFLWNKKGDILRNVIVVMCPFNEIINYPFRLG